MQTANILLALGGDPGNTVPKYGVTPAEIAVLRLIHGDESVSEIEPAEDVQRSSREERARLASLYSRPQPNGPPRSSELDTLFPGVAARLFERLDELELDPSYFKAVARMTADGGAAPVKGEGRKGARQTAAEAGEPGTDTATGVDQASTAEDRKRRGKAKAKAPAKDMRPVNGPPPADEAEDMTDEHATRGVLG
jgi:hypothetical protein